MSARKVYKVWRKFIKGFSGAGDLLYWVESTDPNIKSRAQTKHEWKYCGMT